MINTVLEVLFTLLAVGGLFLLLFGLKMKPEGESAGANSCEENFFQLPFSGDDSTGFFEPGPSGGNLGQGGKETFDPEKHQPDAIGSRKQGS